MKTIYLIYETDAHHSYDTRELKGAYTDLQEAVDAVIANNANDIDEEDVDRTNADIHNSLYQWRQTQGYETNYVIEEINTGHWY